MCACACVCVCVERRRRVSLSVSPRSPAAAKANSSPLPPLLLLSADHALTPFRAKNLPRFGFGDTWWGERRTALPLGLLFLAPLPEGERGGGGDGGGAWLGARQAAAPFRSIGGECWRANTHSRRLPPPPRCRPAQKIARAPQKGAPFPPQTAKRSSRRSRPAASLAPQLPPPLARRLLQLAQRPTARPA